MTIERAIEEAVAKAIQPMAAELAKVNARLEAMNPVSEWVDLVEAAEIKGCHVDTIRRRVKVGELECKRERGRIFVKRAEL